MRTVALVTTISSNSLNSFASCHFEKGCPCWQAAWDESLVITGEDPSQVEDVDDDLARELAFYNQVAETHTLSAGHTNPRLLQSTAKVHTPTGYSGPSVTHSH